MAPSYCPCCDHNLNQPYNTSDATVDLERYVTHVASCTHDPHNGPPVPPNVVLQAPYADPVSQCHIDYQDAVFKECETYDEQQRPRKLSGLAPRMTEPRWAEFMLGRLPVWNYVYPNRG